MTDIQNINELDFFDWKLDEALYKASIFTGKKMVEHANFRKVLGFIKEKKGIKYRNGPRKYKHVARKYETELDQMKQYKEVYDKTTCNFKTSFFLPLHGWGRIHPADHLSLCIFHRPTRHAFCIDDYFDVDIVNCHPRIISQLCKQKGILCPNLDTYSIKAKDIRKKIMEHHDCNKDVAKSLPITLIYGGGYQGWLSENKIVQNKKNLIKIFVEMEKEMTNIRKIVYGLNPHIKDDVLKANPKKKGWDKLEKRERGVMAFWCQSIERRLQEIAIQYLVESRGFKLEDIVPCQDGFMLLKDLWTENNTILEDISTVIFEETKIKVDFLNKPFDEADQSIMEYDGAMTPFQWEDSLSSVCLAKSLLDTYGKYFAVEEKHFYTYWGVFEGNDIPSGMWFNDTDHDDCKIWRFVTEKLYDLKALEIDSAVELKKKEVIDLKNQLRKETSDKTEKLIKHVKKSIKAPPIPFDSNKFLLPFNNGPYDLFEGIHRPFRYDDFITATTGYDYEKVIYNEENQLKKDTLLQILQDIIPDPADRNLLLQFQASCLDGKSYQYFLGLIGAGGNGKSFLASFMSMILGPTFYYSPGAGVLTEVTKANSPSPDIFKMYLARCINLAELGVVVHNSVLKKITGGGEFTARNLKANPRTFKLDGTTMGEMNDPIQFLETPKEADFRRVFQLFLNTLFTDDMSKVGKTINGKTFKKANRYYESPEFLQSHKMIYLEILLEQYSKSTGGVSGIQFEFPQAMIDSSKKILMDQNIFQQLIQKFYVATNNNNDCVRVDDLWRAITSTTEYQEIPTRRKDTYSLKNFKGYLLENYEFGADYKRLGHRIIGYKLKSNDDAFSEDFDLQVESSSKRQRVD